MHVRKASLTSTHPGYPRHSLKEDDAAKPMGLCLGLVGAMKEKRENYGEG